MIKVLINGYVFFKMQKFSLRMVENVFRQRVKYAAV